jgi:chromosomal replication initiator protein
LERLANAIALRVGTQRFQVWFNNSTKLDLRQDGLEIAVPNDFISEFISKRFRKPIQEAAQEVLGCPLDVRFSVMPQLFEPSVGNSTAGNTEAAPAVAPAPVAEPAPNLVRPMPPEGGGIPRSRVRHDIDTFVVGPSNQLAYNTALYVTQFPGAQYNPLFFHGGCGLGKTHLLQGLCRRFQQLHPAKRWSYITGEEFTNEFLTAMRANKLDHFRRQMRDLDLLAIDDVHFLGGKKSDAGRIPAHLQFHRGDGTAGGDGQRRAS